MNRHTPGSWYAVGYQVETGIDDPNVADICTCFPPNFGHPDNRSSEEILANVRLIAAAPVLFEAAQALIAWSEKNPTLEKESFVQKFRNALEQIKG